MDGFLAIINILSTLRTYREKDLTTERREQVLGETIETARLVFVIVSEAMSDDENNSQYFEVRLIAFIRSVLILLQCHVGYDSLWSIGFWSVSRLLNIEIRPFSPVLVFWAAYFRASPVIMDPLIHAGNSGSYRSY